MKKIAFAAIAATTLVLTACSNSDSGSTSETVTVTEPTQAEATKTTAAQKAASFDEAAIRSAVEGAGYQCGNDDCFKEENNVRTEIDFDHDSADVHVEALQDGADIEAAYAAGLKDLGTALEGQDLAGTSWNEVKAWAESSAQEHEARTTLGEWELKLENDTERGLAERSFEIEHVHS